MTLARDLAFPSVAVSGHMAKAFKLDPKSVFYVPHGF
jgi:hypothetical protein